MAERAIVWTATAAKLRRSILRYWLERNKSPAYPKKIVRLISKRLQVIQANPESFPETSFPSARVSAMGHFSIIYRITSKQIIVLAFWDNRQEPDKLLELIKKPE